MTPWGTASLVIQASILVFVTLRAQAKVLGKGKDRQPGKIHSERKTAAMQKEARCCGEARR